MPVNVGFRIDWPSLLVAECTATGSPRRCGGQGDILSGAIATFLSWYHLSPNKYIPVCLSPPPVLSPLCFREKVAYPGTVLAGYAGCCLTRACAAKAFETHKRGTLTTDMIAHIPEVFAENFE